MYVLGNTLPGWTGTCLPGRATYFYHTDHLGSTVLVTDEAVNTVWSSEYTPFGQITMEEGTLAKAAKFTGKDLDEDTGLYYFNARWYDSELGRFISEDPAADPNNPNLYTYCANNPLIHIDPSGNIYLIAWSYGTKDVKKYEQYLANNLDIDITMMGKPMIGMRKYGMILIKKLFARAAYTRKRTIRTIFLRVILRFKELIVEDLKYGKNGQNTI